MNNLDQLPENFQSVSTDQEIIFACHPGVSCFSECCRELDLALTPYDVLRLKRHLNLRSAQFLDRYVIIEWEEGQLFPTYYLTMVDDGRASCVFVQPEGARFTPIVRVAAAPIPLVVEPLVRTGAPVESLVLVREPHCQGFANHGSRRSASTFEAKVWTSTIGLTMPSCP
jgi:hypothetical protein